MWKWLIKKIFKRCFKQGNHCERRILLKSMVEAIENEYTEDNWYSRLYWIVEEILKADDGLAALDIDEGCVAAGLRSSVQDAIEYKKGIIK